MQSEVKASRHTGIVVSDLDRSLAFYAGILGLEPVARKTETGRYIDSVVGLPGVELEWIKLRAPDGYIVELLKYASHPAASKDDLGASNRMGCSHVAFTVNDAAALYSKLVEGGYRCNSAPQASPDGKVMVFYGHDPDGIILEFVEEVG